MQVPRLVVHQTPAMETWSVLRGIASSVPMTVAAVTVKSAVRTVVFKAAGDVDCIQEAYRLC